MPITVKEQWSEYRFAFNRSAQRGFTVHGTDDQAAARTALQTYGVMEGTPHSVDGSLIARPIEWSKRGPQSYHALAFFERIESLGAGGVATPPEWEGGFVEVPDYSERDGRGKLILNAAGDLIDPPVRRTRRIFVLRVYRRESAYEPAKGAAFIDHCNSGAVVVPSSPAFTGGTVAAGCMVLKAYELTQRLTATSQYAPVMYEVWISPEPFRVRVPNVGYNGWWDDEGAPVKARFSVENSSGRPEYLAVPVLLKTNGTPISSTIKVGYLNSPIATPSGQVAQPLGTEGSDADGYELLYQEYPEIDFAGLDLFDAPPPPPP